MLLPLSSAICTVLFIFVTGRHFGSMLPLVFVPDLWISCDVNPFTIFVYFVFTLGNCPVPRRANSCERREKALCNRVRFLIEFSICPAYNAISGRCNANSDSV
jgi:hypothetical protein